MCERENVCVCVCVSSYCNQAKIPWQSKDEDMRLSPSKYYRDLKKWKTMSFLSLSALCHCTYGTGPRRLKQESTFVKIQDYERINCKVHGTD